MLFGQKQLPPFTKSTSVLCDQFYRMNGYIYVIKAKLVETIIKTQYKSYTANTCYYTILLLPEKEDEPRNGIEC